MRPTILVVGCANMAYVFGKLRHIPDHDVYHVYGDEALRLAKTLGSPIALVVTEPFHPLHSGIDPAVSDNGISAGPLLIHDLRQLRPETTFILLNASPEQERLISHDQVLFVQAPDFWKLGSLQTIVEHHLHLLPVAA